MRRRPSLAGMLSLLVPGLGQIYGGDGRKGAAILFAAITIANLDILILPLISMANPVMATGSADVRALWAYWIPRVVHDVASLWSIVFWLWASLDAIAMTRRANSQTATDQ